MIEISENIDQNLYMTQKVKYDNYFKIKKLLIFKLYKTSFIYLPTWEC